MKRVIFLLATLVVTSIPALARGPVRESPGAGGGLLTTVTPAPARDPFADRDDSKAMGPHDSYGDPACGRWVADRWKANGRCPGYTAGPYRARIAGTVIGVHNHRVTVQQNVRSIVIDDRPVFGRNPGASVKLGRELVAYGYWSGERFYATALEESSP